MATEWGLFNDEAVDYTDGEAVEAGFWSHQEALDALEARYTEEDELHIHAIEEEEEDEEEDEDEE
jgi:hypothetical protein